MVLNGNEMISADDLISFESADSAFTVFNQGKAKLLLNKERLQKLNLSNCNLGPDDISILATKTIPTIPGLVGVDISRNQISADVAPMLIESIQKSA